MNRRKSVVIPNDVAPVPEKKFRSPFATFRRAESSRNFQPMDSHSRSGTGLAPVDSTEEEHPSNEGVLPQDIPRDTSISEHPVTPNGAAPISEASPVSHTNTGAVESAQQNFPSPPVRTRLLNVAIFLQLTKCRSLRPTQKVIQDVRIALMK